MDAPRLFHLTGRRTDATLAPIDGRGLRPALLAPYRDLTRLRYDFPLVLGDGDPPAATLSGLFDAAVEASGPAGPARDRMRRLLRLVEREIRVLAAEGAAGTLETLWDLAIGRLAVREGEQLRLELAALRASIPLEGEVVDCDEALPAHLVRHLWRDIEADRATSTGRYIDSLIERLSQLVRADYARSEAGRTAPALRAAIGARHQELFDFGAMARLLAGPSGAIGLSESRRQRIAATVAALKGQRFFGERAWSFAFRRVDIALAAYHERLPHLAELVRAMSVAELELAGAYDEAAHDRVFAGFDETALAPEDIARFPSYFVRVDADDRDGTTRALLLEALTSGAPMKILLEIDDVFGLGGRLATTALGLGDAFVVQATSAELFRRRDALHAALAYRGAALLSVFGGGMPASAIPPYLIAAAAAESRAFPGFTYDPSAAPDLAGRLSLDGAAQPDRPWPVHPVRYADDDLQRVEERLPFTPVDFALCEASLEGCFAEVPRAAWTDELVPAGERLDGTSDVPDGVPYVWAVDADDRLRRLVVDERLMRATQRLAGAWARLVEMAAAPAMAAPPPAAPVPEAAVAAAPAAAAEPLAPAAAAQTSDDPYIETPRCTTCNECTILNGRMFAYNENRQAYVKDPLAGTYRELVEAAEGCQVAIIHPGKPRDPNEPGLAELIARAEPFR